MPARRFFIEDVHTAGDRVAIAGSDAHKIAHVLRLRPGDEIEVVDSAGTLFQATLEGEGESLEAHLRELLAAPETGVRIDVAQAVPRGQKMDFVVEKLTELGVSAILPFTSERVVVRDVGEAKVERWRRLARSASQQCGRTTIPSIEEPLGFEALCARFAQYDAVLFPWELATDSLRERLSLLVENAGSVLVVIGPEGGFSHAEAERGSAAGAHLVSLGRRILRTETAALVLVSILTYFLDS